MSGKRWITVLIAGVVGVTLAAVATATAATTPSAPPGYRLLNTVLPAPAHTQTGTLQACPAGTVVWGGGGGLQGSLSDGFGVNTSSINTSADWRLRVNNASAAANSFNAWLVCAQKPAGYTIASSAAVANPAGMRTTGSVKCPAGTVVLHGGVLSTSTSTAVNLNAAWPKSTTSYSATVTNGSGTAASFFVQAICAKQPAGYKLVTRTDTVPAPTLVSTAALCPAKTAVVGGGAKTNPFSSQMALDDSVPQTGEWSVTYSDTATVSEKISTFAICAR